MGQEQSQTGGFEYDDTSASGHNGVAAVHSAMSSIHTSRIQDSMDITTESHAARTHALPPITNSTSTISYLIQLIAEAESNTANGHAHHDVTLLRYQLQTIHAATEQTNQHRREIVHLVDDDRIEPETIDLTEDDVDHTATDRSTVKQEQIHPTKKMRKDDATSSMQPTRHPHTTAAASMHVPFRLPRSKKKKQISRETKTDVFIDNNIPLTVQNAWLQPAPQQHGVKVETSSAISSMTNETTPSEPLQSVSYDLASPVLPSMMHPDKGFVSPFMAPLTPLNPPISPFASSWDEYPQLQNANSTNHAEMEIPSDHHQDTNMDGLTGLSSVASPLADHLDPDRIHDFDPLPGVAAASDASSSSASVASTGLASTSSSTNNLSKAFLSNLLHSDSVAALKRQFQAGAFSPAAAREQLIWMASSIEADQQAELIEHLLSQVTLKDGPIPPPLATPAAHLEALVPPSSGVSSSVASIAAVSPSSSDHPSAATIPGFLLSSREAREDDSDGVARMVWTLYIPPSAATNDGVRAPRVGERKRKKQIQSDSALAPSAETVEEDDAQSQLASIMSTSIPVATPTRQPMKHMDLMLSVNRSWERLCGYTQSAMVDLLHTKQMGIMFEHIRSDHLVAMHRLITRFGIECLPEAHLYLVRHHPDGHELYCLVHLRLVLDHGMMLEAVASFLPLPQDPLFPPPPFVPGVDLPDSVLLFGYKLPHPLADSVGIIPD